MVYQSQESWCYKVKLLIYAQCVLDWTVSLTATALASLTETDPKGISIPSTIVWNLVGLSWVVFFRVPLRLRGAQQKITPDVQTGCISCATGDGKYGAPIWWNSALGDDDTTEEENRATWSQVSLKYCKGALEISSILLNHGSRSSLEGLECNIHCCSGRCISQSKGNFFSPSVKIGTLWYQE